MGRVFRVNRLRVSQRTVGKAMIAIGVAGIVIGLTTVVASHSMIRQVETSVDDSLQLTGEALSAVTDSIAVTDEIVGSVRSGMTSIQTTMATVEKSLGEGSTALTQGGEFLGGSLPKALEAVNGVLPTIQSIAKSVDDTLELLDEVPFGPNYQPVEPFDAAIGRLSAAMQPLPNELRTLSASFDNLTATSAVMARDVAKLGTDIAALNAKLVDVGVLLDRYSATAGKADALAQASRKDLANSANLTRWWLTLLGVVFALGQLVPIWLGSVLLANADAGRTIVTRAPRRDTSASTT
jgi:methyl-accepting chemotaxis protein